MKNLSTGCLLDYYAPLLTVRQREALDMYYNMDYSLSEIADHFAVTRQCVRGYIQTGEANMQRFEAVLGHAALHAAADALRRATIEKDAVAVQNAVNRLSEILDME